MNSSNIETIVRKVVETLANQPISYTNGNIPVGVSARHVHLSAADLETLFGTQYSLTQKSTLMGGQYAAAETVTIVSAKLRTIENVRILGPTRAATQVEISATDAVRLGLCPPLRESGDIHGSAPITIVGPAGAVHLVEGCIIAARHIHMSPKDAVGMGVTDGDIISVKTENPRGLTFDNVKIRVAPSFTLEMHIDTDEANAAGLKTGDTVRRAAKC